MSSRSVAYRSHKAEGLLSFSSLNNELLGTELLASVEMLILELCYVQDM